MAKQTIRGVFTVYSIYDIAPLVLISMTPNTLRGYCIPNLKLACFVCYLKIIDTFSKNDTCMLK